MTIIRVQQAPTMGYGEGRVDICVRMRTGQGMIVAWQVPFPQLGKRITYARDLDTEQQIRHLTSFMRLRAEPHHRLRLHVWSQKHGSPQPSLIADMQPGAIVQLRREDECHFAKCIDGVTLPCPHGDVPHYTLGVQRYMAARRGTSRDRIDWWTLRDTEEGRITGEYCRAEEGRLL